ncbi:MAG: U32 family peptidase [Desulfohalobiaceae bacterium]|nr:U32 family peptidase [Desulfohalobiaceae bacterium]
MHESPPRLPELLAPAGDLRRMRTALAYGADAVYLGGPEHNLRAKTRGVSLDELPLALQEAKRLGRKVYFCLNVLPRQDQLDSVRAYLDALAGYQLDGLILADPGVLALARKRVPKIPIHLSTQANTGNGEAARFWLEQGVSRVNLARELDLSGIRAIRSEMPDMELEVFVHGAMCMAISGRCLLSAHLNGRSANQGMCTHPCRFGYRPLSLTLEEGKRPGEPVWEVLEEDGGYSSILAAEDLCLVKYLAWFVRLGLDALKIEGRMKTGSYLGVVTDVYATALQDLKKGDFRPGLYLLELGRAASRPLGTGFFLPGKRKRLFDPGKGAARAPILGQIKERAPAGKVWEVLVKHRWQADDCFQILVPGLKRPLIQAGEYALENDRGQRVSEIHSGQTVFLGCEHPDLGAGLLLRRS